MGASTIHPPKSNSSHLFITLGFRLGTAGTRNWGFVARIHKSNNAGDGFGEGGIRTCPSANAGLMGIWFVIADYLTDEAEDIGQ